MTDTTMTVKRHVADRTMTILSLSLYGWYNRELSIFYEADKKALRFSFLFNNMVPSLDMVDSTCRDRSSFFWSQRKVINILCVAEELRTFFVTFLFSYLCWHDDHHRLKCMADRTMTACLRGWQDIYAATLISLSNRTQTILLFCGGYSGDGLSFM